MSVDSIQSIAGWEGVSSSLREIRDCHAETWAFFRGIFEDLNLFSISLDARRKHLVENIPTSEPQPQAVAAEFGQQLSQLFTQRDTDREELRETRETVREQVAQLATVVSELASAQSEFHANFQLIREEIARNREAFARELADPPPVDSGENVELERKLTDLERQHAALEQDRALLEKELEGVRNRAAELAESLAEQKRLAQQQQTQGNAELQRMRVLLETIARQDVLGRPECETMPAAAASETTAPRAAKSEASAAADPVLGSVLAQFEMLQQDRARRRA